MKDLYHLFRRFVQKQTIKAIRYVQTDYEKSAYENDSISICKKLINQKDSTLLLTPLSNKRYIKNDSMGIFITIEGNLIKVINHKYSYVVPMSDKSIKDVTDVFNSTVEKQRKKMEDEISSNIKHSLRDISVNLD